MTKLHSPCKYCGKTVKVKMKKNKWYSSLEVCKKCEKKIRDTLNF